MASQLLDIDSLLQKLTLDEKIILLSGIGRCRTRGLEHHGIPSIKCSDGPHGVRTEKFFNPPKVAALPSGTAMGATFDCELLHRIGILLAAEAKAHDVQWLLAPVVCLQRSPLIGRGFEAFGEDPILSGTLGGQFINGLQQNGIAAGIKHYAAHDQSDNSIEDNIIMTERTLREVHTLPFQIAIRDSNPWAIMSSYNKINGTHVSEDPKLLTEVLRGDWGFPGLVVCDWWGLYSTSEAINAGMDLEMPGPPDWRAKILSLAVRSRKVRMDTIDTSVRRFLEFINRILEGQGVGGSVGDTNTPEARSVIRKLTAESVVLLKNEYSILPLSKEKERNRYALIGDHWKIPAVAGGGSSEVEPHYVVTPYDAIVETMGDTNITSALGCYSHKFAPLLSGTITQPKSTVPGFTLEFFDKDFRYPDAKLIYETTTVKSSMASGDSLPDVLQEVWFARIRTVFKASKTMQYRFGLSGAGKIKLFINGTEAIDLWTNHPEKTDNTPCFNGFTMERFVDVDVDEGAAYDLEIHLVNEDLDDRVGAAPAGGVRLGGFEVVDEEDTIREAVNLAREVDIPIILTGLGPDYEYEGCDRKTLGLPRRVDELIERVIEANSNTVIITEAGTAIALPWADKAKTMVHAWLGGQETGHGITDVLFGRVNPSGRLSLTFPRRLEDMPSFLNFGKSDVDIVYGEGVFIGHRYYEKLDRPPQFYFGHGLSYTKFKYSNLVIPPVFKSTAANILQLKVDITNIGNLGGGEVIQVYISDPECSVQRPKRELKAFRKVYIEAGATETVTISLDKYALSFWDQRASRWMAEAGIFRVIFAASADPKAELIQGSFELEESFTWTGL
ncbi:glycoside hydrolase superfamily [Aspergillus aurantiobrunneus]